MECFDILNIFVTSKKLYDMSQNKKMKKFVIFPLVFLFFSIVKRM